MKQATGSPQERLRGALQGIPLHLVFGGARVKRLGCAL